MLQVAYIYSLCMFTFLILFAYAFVSIFKCFMNICIFQINVNVSALLSYAKFDFGLHERRISVCCNI
jgi:hypothetical protein